MKTFIALSAMLVSLHAVADQACYQLAATAEAVSENVPQEICLESLAVNAAQSSVTVSSQSTPQLFKEVQLRELARTGDHASRFKASSLVYASNFGCLDFEEVELHIAGFVNNQGEAANLKNLTVSVERQATKDACHLEPRLKVFQYVLK